MRWVWTERSWSQNGPAHKCSQKWKTLREVLRAILFCSYKAEGSGLTGFGQREELQLRHGEMLPVVGHEGKAIGKGTELGAVLCRSQRRTEVLRLRLDPRLLGRPVQHQ